MTDISPAQARAARGLLNWPQKRLAGAARVSLSTIADFERGRRIPIENNLAALQRALESAGVVFIPVNGGGAGVRMRDP